MKLGKRYSTNTNANQELGLTANYLLTRYLYVDSGVKVFPET